MQDSSFDIWASDDECPMVHRPEASSPITVDSDVRNLLTASPQDQDHCYLLVKNLPQDITEREVWDLFQDTFSMEKVIILAKTSNVYLKFSSAAEIQSIITANENLPMVYKDQKLKFGSVFKLPLDLNHASKVVLLTIYDEKIEITAQAVYQIFKEASRPLRIIVFKKKNHQVFMEFDSVEEAANFRETFDNINFNGFFFLKVQFTRKNSLNITKNSPMEHDFTPELEGKVKCPTLDLSYLDQIGIKPIAGYNPGPFCGSNTNVVPSLQNFDDFAECASPSDFLKDSAYLHDQTRDTSEDKAEYFYLLHISNLHPDLRVKAIFNLFSLYGNIEKISTDFGKRKATIFYPSEFEQMTAHHCLGGLKLYSQDLDIRTSKIKRNAPISAQYPNLVQYRCKKDTPQTNTLSKLRVINKPHNVLYVFNLTPVVTLESIRQMFAKQAPVEDIYYSNDSKNSALVLFKTIDDAAKILCLFKNTNLGEKSLKINFANSNLLKAKDASQRKNKFVSLQSFNEVSPLVDFDASVVNKKPALWEQNPKLKLLRKKVGA